MQTEIEAKFLNVNHDEIRERLKKAGAKLEQPMRLMRRSIIDYPNRRLQTEQDSWLRLRDEGDKVTLTFKHSVENEFAGAHEIETTVGSFEDARKIFLAAGFKEHSFQESKREAWKLDDCEVVLDEWPWIKTYIEIEGDSEEEVKKVAGKLGFKWEDASFGGTTVAFAAEYPGINFEKGDTIGLIPEIKFGAPLPQYLRDRQ